MDPEELQDYQNRTILGRLGEPIDVANTALFLSSDESRYITGQILAVSWRIITAPIIYIGWEHVFVY